MLEDPKGLSEFGTSSGSPIDVTMPDNLKYPTVFITEGKFKAIQIAKNYNCIALSVQGITTWRGIIEVIKSLETSEEVTKWYDKAFEAKNIFIAFDADLCYNPSVYDQLKNLADNLKTNFPQKNIYYVYWNVELGKGIDDVIHSDKKEFIKKYNKDTFDASYKEVVEIAKTTEGVESVDFIAKEKFKQYFDKHMKFEAV